MNLGEGIAFSGLAIGFLTFVYKVTNDEAGKRTRIYARVDEVKKGMEEKLQSKEICDIHILAISNDLAEIKKDVKTLLAK